jgi:DNA-binding beta-propeller fold protein YncE
MYRLMPAFLLILPLAMTMPAQGQDFYSPVRLTKMPSGELVIVDSRRQTLSIWDPQSASVVRVIDAPGRPVSVAYGWNYLFVGNEMTQSVDVVRPKNGKLRYILGGKNFHIQRPSDIAVDIDQGLVFVTDSATASVLVFDKGGDLLRSLPAAGQPPLYRPTGLAVDPVKGEVLVSDFGDPVNPDASVTIYDYDGIFKASVDGSAGCGSFGCSGAHINFSRPQGLAVNSQGLIYVVDSVLGQVLVFDRDTTEGVAAIGTKGKGPQQLWLPLDLAIGDDNNDLYVTNNRNRRLEVFLGKGLLP